MSAYSKCRASVAVALFVCALQLLVAPCHSQNPSSCKTSGYSAYSFTAVYDGVANTTTYYFTFYNLSPIGVVYVNVGEVFFDSFPPPVGTPVAPPGWEFKSVGGKLFYQTTSSPWWKTPPSIKPGDSLSGFNYVISGPPDPSFIVFTHVQNVTDASGTVAGPARTWFDCSVVYKPPVNKPCISVTKTPKPVQVNVGQTVTYTYKVCNCGDAALAVTSLEDSNESLGNILNDFIAANGGSDLLDAGDCVEFSLLYVVRESDDSPLRNCVEVEAEDDHGKDAKDKACASVVINQTRPEPCVNISKTANPTTVTAGDTVTYTYKVCNCGNVALTVTSLTDSNPAVGNLLPNFIAANGGSAVLGVGACVQFSTTCTTQASDPSSLQNCAKVKAKYGEDDKVSDEACASVLIKPAEPCIDIAKTPNPTTVNVGDTVTYTYKVCNCGNMALTVTSLTDSNPGVGNLLSAFIAANGGSSVLAIGNCVQFGVAYITQAGDPSPLQNCATVNAHDSLAHAVSDEACATVLISKPQPVPCVSITKTPDPAAVNAGDTVTYTYEVCNCGTAALTVTSVTDSNPSIGSLLDEFIAANGGSDVLATGDCVQFSAAYVTQLSDPSPLQNCVTVNAQDDLAQQAGDRACATVLISKPQPVPCIDVTKTANPTVLQGGGTVTYTYRVCNCGNEQLTVTSLVDTNPTIGDLLDEFKHANGGSDVISAGACVTFTVDYETQPSDPSHLINCVTVEAQDDLGHQVSDEACATVVIIMVGPGPCVQLTKTADPTVANPYQLVTYTYQVCNCGDPSLTVTSLSDSNPDIGDMLDRFKAANGGSDVLPSGQCVQFSVGYLVKPSDPQPLVNCATVSAVDPDLEIVDSTSCARVDQSKPPVTRKCNRPVTFTQELWHFFGNPANPIVPGGVLYSRFPKAMEGATYYGHVMSNCCMVGNPFRTNGKAVEFEGTSRYLDNLVEFLPQVGPPGPVLTSYENVPYLGANPGVLATNALAGEMMALMMNMAYNDMQQMIRYPGYDFDQFRLAKGVCKGLTVKQVMLIANEVLSGTHPRVFGLPESGPYEVLTDIIRQINSNYAFLGWDWFIDRGYLRPNRPFGLPGPPHHLSIP